MSVSFQLFNSDGGYCNETEEILFVLAVVATTSAPAPLIGHLGTQERGPAVSSPQVRMDENGDRVSHYPPYYHPEHSGGGRR